MSVKPIPGESGKNKDKMNVAPENVDASRQFEGAVRETVGKAKGGLSYLLDTFEFALAKKTNKPKKAVDKAVDKSAKKPADIKQNEAGLESKEFKKETKYRTVEYKDNLTGYMVKIHVPEGKEFDPQKDAVSFYFPGDGGSNRAMSAGKTGKTMLDKMPEGVYAVVSGDVTSGSKKYVKLGKQGAWDNLVQGVGQQLNVKADAKLNTVAIGYSRGGGALNRILASKEAMPGKVVLLDTCREPIYNVVSYLEKGGKVDFYYADHRSLGNLASLKSKFNLKLQADGALVSENGNLTIFPRFKTSHNGAILAYMNLNQPKVDVSASASVAASSAVSAVSSVAAPIIAASTAPIIQAAVNGGSKTYQGSSEPSFVNTPEKMNSTVEQAFNNLLRQVAASKSLDTQRVSGHCEQYSDKLRAVVGKILGGPNFKFDYSLNFKAPILSNATKVLRGKRMDKLSSGDFNGIPNGAVFFVNTPGKYGKSIVPGTDNPLPKIADKRHWFTKIADGPLFADNWGNEVSLQGMQRLVANRVVLNVYDPYANIRSKMILNNAGQLALNDAPQSVNRGTA